MVGGISGWQLLILLLIVLLVFGTKRLRTIGSDLGSAVKGFRDGMGEKPDDEEPEQLQADPAEQEAATPPPSESDPANRPPGSSV